jgi:hypothetical protein
MVVAVSRESGNMIFAPLLAAWIAPALWAALSLVAASIMVQHAASRKGRETLTPNNAGNLCSTGTF